jgi:hypothetical protein
MFTRIGPKSSGGRWLRLMMAEAHVGLDNCQQFIDKGANEKFVYLSNWKP